MIKNCQKSYPLETHEGHLKTIHIFAKKFP